MRSSLPPGPCSLAGSPSRPPARAPAWPMARRSRPPDAELPLRYVALGDSYSAASGVLPPDPAPP